MGKSYLIPTWIPDRTLKHIHKNHEEHITREDIKEVLNRDLNQLEIARSARDHESDVMVRGQSVDGKKLQLCVIINKERIRRLVQDLEEAPPVEWDRLGSAVYNGWEIKE